MIFALKRYFKFYSLPILSGIFIGTSFIPFPAWALVFCYIPLWFFITERATNWKHVLWGAWWTQFFLSLIGFYWIATTAHDFGYISWPLSVGVLLLFAAFMHLYVPGCMVAGFILSQRFQLNRGATLLLFAGMLTLGEMFWPSLFEWNMGYPLLWLNFPMIHWADVIGIQGLSFVVYLTNAWLLWTYFGHTQKKVRLTSVGIVFCICALSWLGIQKANFWKNTDSQLSVLAVQANIGNNEKRIIERHAGKTATEIFYDLTRDGLAKYPQTQMVIWPETAFPYSLDRMGGYRNRRLEFSSFVKEIGRPIITGAFSRDDPSVANPRIYNAMFLFDEQGESNQPPYHKTNLLAFGETIPYIDRFPKLAKYVPGGPGFGRGKGPMIFQHEGVNYGPQICYESLDPQFSAKLSKLGADILMNVTNDSWFGKKTEPYQHMLMTLARAIEVRRPLVRSTNTGISSAILADGTILERSPIDEEWFGNFEIKYLKNAPVTFYAKFGSWLWVLMIGFIGTVLALGKNVYKEHP